MLHHTGLFVLLAASVSGNQAARKPNIVFILADDLGWNDVSFHGYNEIPTPNIDRLASEGVALNGHYGQNGCTPSRTALMTGKYPIRYGFQRGVLMPGEPRCLGLEEKLLPQYMKDLGYGTHMVGKWHLGYSSKNCTPTLRGFDSFYGSYSPQIDYYSHTSEPPGAPYFGKDLVDNLESVRNSTGQYITDVFTAKSIQVIRNHDFEQPLFLYVSHYAPHNSPGPELVQAPQGYVDRFRHISHEGRRKYAGVIAALDDSVGETMAALDNKGVLANTMIIFASDNGGSGHELTNIFGESHGSNWPLRGTKGTHWEACIRVPAVLWGKGITDSGLVTNELFHMTDWLPTLVQLAGGEAPAGIDGFDIWDSISKSAPSPRTEVLIQANSDNDEFIMRWNHFKFMSGMGVYGPFGPALSWYEPVNGINASFLTNSPARLYCEPANPSLPPCNPLAAPCLFDVVSDPCERNNVVEIFPEVVRLLWEKLLAYNASAVPPKNVPPDPNASPALHDGYLRPWLD